MRKFSTIGRSFEPSSTNSHEAVEYYDDYGLKKLCYYRSYKLLRRTSPALRARELLGVTMCGNCRETKIMIELAIWSSIFIFILLWGIDMELTCM